MERGLVNRKLGKRKDLELTWHAKTPIENHTHTKIKKNKDVHYKISNGDLGYNY